MRKMFTLLIFSLLWAGSTWGQVSTYSFASSSGTYTAITGGTMLKDGTTTMDSWASTAQTIPSFTFNGVAYTTAFVTSNGIITLGGAAPSSSATTGISSTVGSGIALCPFSGDLDRATTTAATEIRWETVGNEVIFQWTQVKRYGSTNAESFDMQARLNTSSGNVVFVYKLNIGPGSSTSYFPQVGIRTSASDYNNRLVASGTEDWATSLQGATNASTCRFTSVAPAKGFTTGLTFTYAPPAAGTPLPPTTPSPANAAVNIPVNGSTTWTFGTNTTTYDLKFGPTGSMTQVVTGATAGATGSYTYSGLNTSAVYQWQVIEHNGALTTNGPIWSFSTVCGTYTVPFVENFDSYTVPAVGCGTIIDANADLVKWANSTSAPYNGLNKLHIGYSAAGVTQDDWYITPGIVLAAGQSYDVKFWYRGGSSTYLESIEVKYGNAPTAAGMTSNAIFSDISFYKAAYTLGAATFVAANSGTYYFGWHCISIGDQLGMDVDQITVEATPACPAPLTVTASAVSSSSISIGWTGTPTTVQIDYGTVGHAAGSGTLVSGVTLNPTTITGLTSNTAYDVFVRQDCGSGTYSPWTGPVTVYTLCGVSALFSENFDAVTAPAMPNCWAKVGTSGSANTQNTSSSSSPNCLYLYGYSATTATVSMAPVSNAGANTHQLRFKMRANFTIGEAIQIGYLTDPLDDASFVSVTSVVANSLNYVEYMVDLGTAAGTNQYLAFKHPGTLGNSVLIDDVVWEVKPACSAPINLTAAPEAFQAILGWNANGTTAWDIEWGLSGFVQGTGTTITGVTNPYTLSGLAPTTAYSYFVRANCGANGYSVWSGPASFTTSVACPAPTILTAVTSGFQAILGWTPNGPATSWDIEWGLSGFTQGTGTVITGVTNPYTLTGLTPSTGYAYYVRSDCGSGSTSTWSGPKTFTTTVACPAPTTLTVTGILNNQASLGWTNPGGALWDIEWGLSGFTQGSGTIVSSSSNPYVLTGLTAGTAYSWYVRQNCGGSQSTWVGPNTFTTQSVVPAPYEMGFTTTTIPSGWNTTGWSIGSLRGVTGNPGNNIYKNFYSAAATGTFSTVNVGPVATGMLLTFDYKLANYSSPYDPPIAGSGNYTVSVSTDFGVNYTDLETMTNNAVAGWQSKVYSLSAYIGQNVKIKIVGNWISGDYDLAFDNFRIGLPITCPTPTNLTATSITGTSAVLGWTENGSASIWNIEWGPTGFAQGAGTILTEATNPQTLTGLIGATQYDFYVQADCRGGSISAWSEVKTFVTSCGVSNLPYVQNFDAVTAPAIPLCMTVTNNNADAVQWVTSTSAPRSTANAMRISYNGSLAMDDWFFTPALALQPGNYKVSFWYRSSGATYAEKLEVKWGSTPNAAGMTSTAIFNNSNIINSTYEEGTGVINITTAGVYYVGWHGYSDADMFYLLVDDINIYQPLAHDVSTVSINNISSVVDLTPITPKATVKNEGTNPETFTVTTTITGGYTSTKTVTALAPGATQEVIFDLWTPTIGAFSAQTCTNLGTDMLSTNNCVTVTGEAFNYTRFYNYIAFGGTSGLPEGPGYFYKEAPGTVVSLAPTTSDQFISAGTWADGIWYASEYYDDVELSGGGWYTINPGSGAMIKISDLERSFTGITYDHTTNTMYGVDYDDVAGTNNLYTINRATGVATLLGTVATGQLFINLATNSSGLLYSLSITDYNLYSISTTGTPTATIIGSTGLDLNYGQDMEYDYASNTMYAAAYTTAGSLYTVNLTTGLCTLVGGFAGGAEITGLAIPYTSASATKTLNLSGIMLEGLYNGSGTMRQANNDLGPEYGAGIADAITVELHNATNYSVVEYTAANVMLGTDGTATISDIPDSFSGQYYITIKHRNSIETTTATAVSFAGGIISQSFAATADVYGGNLVMMIDGFYAIYGGDVNQDLIIDTQDIGLIDFDISNFATGYVATDANGDGLVDTNDTSIVDRNISNFVTAILP